MKSIASSHSWLAFLVLTTVGCGRPATEEECLTILRKAARVELETRFGKDEKLIAAELVEVEASMKSAMTKRCVGKRISDETMRCVERAKTKDELFGECFR